VGGPLVPAIKQGYPGPSGKKDSYRKRKGQCRSRRGRERPIKEWGLGPTEIKIDRTRVHMKTATVLRESKGLGRKENEPSKGVFFGAKGKKSLRLAYLTN